MCLIFISDTDTDDQKGNACIVSFIKTQTKANLLVTSQCTIVKYKNACPGFHLIFASTSKTMGISE